MDEYTKTLLKGLPKMDDLLLHLERRRDLPRTAAQVVKTLCRTEVERLRLAVLNGTWQGPPPDLEQALNGAVAAIRALHRYRLRRVINATGVILHTNLGRAPLCPEAIERIVAVSRGYSNLEYDLDRGERGLRYDSVRDLLCLLTGAEDALVVNNNAAAVLLVLNTLCQGKEAIVSRGELIEIGGEFRIPEVMEKSGGRLREVGTTNRTRLKDYEEAIGPETSLIMKVHTSNFRILGFTEETDLIQLVALGKHHGLPVLDDLGSGCLVDLGAYGLGREPTVADVVASGVDVVTFSGDKLLGGPQAGLILGKGPLMDRIRRNPLNRALRIDKLTLAALEATLRQYLDPEAALERIQTLKALTEHPSRTARRARRLSALLRKLAPAALSVALATGEATAGGGSLPLERISTTLVALSVTGLSAAALERRLRRLECPIVARIEGERVFLDARTLLDEELPLIRDGLAELLASRPEAFQGEVQPGGRTTRAD